MLKKSFFLLLCLALVVTGLVACGGDPAETTAPHTHTMSTEWSSDEFSHWYAATCEHTDVKANFASHEDKENDGVCDICGYGEDHTHTFAEDWSFDATDHWHKSTCNHSVVSEKAPHVDTNEDGKCEVCPSGADHEHTFATEWSSDATNHWYAPSCGHKVDGINKAAHVDTNNDGTCDICQYNGGHEHTFATEWSTDGNKHWHASTCNHSVVKDEAAHVDANNDGACDTCKYDGDHKHGYSDEWAFDASNHWHAPTCGHNVAGIDKAAHADNNGDKACDVCGYTTHSHTFNTAKWYFDGNEHWHAATCGCSIVKDEAAHVDANEDGKCDICPYIDSIVNAFNIAISDSVKGHVAGGTITDNYGNVSHYVYGDNYFYYDDQSNNEKKWYTVIDGELICLVENYNGLALYPDAEPDSFTGPYLYGPLSYNVIAYGVENMIIGIYNYGIENVGDGVISGFDYATSTWRFSYQLLRELYNWDTDEYETAILTMTVTFTVNEAGAIDHVTITERTTTNIDVDDQGNYFIKGESEDDTVNTWVYNQVLGGRVATFPYNMNDFYFTEVEFESEEGEKLGDKLDVVLGDNKFYSISVFAPESANARIDVPAIIMKDADGNELDMWNNSIAASFETYDLSLVIRVKEEGTYTVEIKTANVTKTVTVTAVAPAPEYVEPQVYTEKYGSWSNTVTSEYTVITGMEFYFGAAVNEYADDSYTYKLISGDKSACLLQDAELENWDGIINATKFMALSAGTYEVEITSAVDSSLTAVLTITVKNPPSITDILKGTWEMDGGRSSTTVKFTPASEGATEGTLTVEKTSMWGSGGSAEFSYTYDADNKTVVLTQIGGDSLYVDELRVNDDYTLSLYFNGYEQGVMTQLSDGEGGEFSISDLDGVWTCPYNGSTIFFDVNSMSGVFDLYSDGMVLVAFSFTVEAGTNSYGDSVQVLTFTYDEGTSFNPDEALAIFNFDDVNADSYYVINLEGEPEVVLNLFNPRLGFAMGTSYTR